LRRALEREHNLVETEEELLERRRFQQQRGERDL
jgi:hypothetical protein